jgi:CRISPR-associated protein Cas1
MTVLVLTRKDRIARKSRSELLVFSGSSQRDYSLRDVTLVLVMGSSTQISADVLTLLSSMNIPLVVSNKLGVSISSSSFVTVLSATRESQYKLSDEEKKRISRIFIDSKLKGTANLLKYLKVSLPSFQESDDLLVYEANNSRMLWDALFKVLPDWVAKIGRKPRNPDPFNKALTACYAVLYGLSTRALLSFGLDPGYGFMHKSRYSTALSFDYSEMFKPVAVHAVIRAIKKGLEMEGEELSRDSVRKVMEELFSLLSRKQGNQSIYMSIFSRARSLSEVVRNGDSKAHISFVYDPRKLSKDRKK